VEPTVPGLDPGILEERGAVLDELVWSIEELDRPAGKRPAQLPELVRVTGRENELHGRATTSWL
jgi:hypothetical protein